MEPYNLYLARHPCGCIAAAYAHYYTTVDSRDAQRVLGEWVMRGLKVERSDDDSVIVTGCRCSEDWPAQTAEGSET